MTEKEGEREWVKEQEQRSERRKGKEWVGEASPVPWSCLSMNKPKPSKIFSLFIGKQLRGTRLVWDRLVEDRLCK